MVKVSVIIPVYGVEKYIERCARSLFEQTLEDMEFIFVDDCSPDNSILILLKVLEEYPNRKSQTIIEKMHVNSGLPAVRKYGIEKASGEFVIACDSDDYVDKEMYNHLYSTAVKEDFDLLQCDIDVVDDFGVLYTLSCDDNHISSDKLKKMIINGDISNSLCNKLIKRTVYLNNPLIYPKAGMNEDNTLSSQLAFYSKKLGYIKRSYYKAYCNTNSMSRAQNDSNVLKRYNEAMLNSKIDIAFLKGIGLPDRSKAVRRAKLRPKYVLWPNVRNQKSYDLWRNTYPEINNYILFDNTVSLLTRIRNFVIISSPSFYRLYCFWRRCRKSNCS